MSDAEQVKRAVAGHRVSGSGWVRADCPFCVAKMGSSSRSKSKLNYRPDNGYYDCKRCGVVGFTHDRDPHSFSAPKAPVDFEMPSHYLPLWEEPAISADSAADPRAYMVGRGVPIPVWSRARIGVCLLGKDTGRIIIPCVDERGEWWGWVGRAWKDGRQKRYHNSPGMDGSRVYNCAALKRKTDKPFVMVEGCYDALPYWPDAGAFLGKPNEPQIESLINAARPIVVVLDGDAWEEGEMLAMRLRFNGVRAGSVRLPPTTDPSNVDHAWLREEVDRAV